MRRFQKTEHSRIAALKEAKAEVDNVLREEIKTHNDAKKQIQIKDWKIAHLNEIISRLEAQVADLHEEKDALLVTISTLKREIAALEKERRATEKYLADLESKLEERDATIKQLQKQKESAFNKSSKSLDQSEAIIMATSQSVDSLVNAIQSRVIRIQSKFESGTPLSVEELQNEQRQIGVLLANIINIYNDTVNRLNRETGRATLSTSTTQHLARQIQTLQTQINNEINRANNIQNSYNDVVNRLNGQTARANMATSTVQNLAQQIQTLQTQVNNEVNRANHLQNALDVETNRTNQTRRELNRISSRFTRAVHDRVKLQRQIRRKGALDLQRAEREKQEFQNNLLNIQTDFLNTINNVEHQLEVEQARADQLELQTQSQISMSGILAPSFSGRPNESVENFIQRFRGHLNAIGVDPKGAGGPPSGRERALGILISCFTGQAADWYTEEFINKNWELTNLLDNTGQNTVAGVQGLNIAGIGANGINAAAGRSGAQIIPTESIWDEDWSIAGGKPSSSPGNLAGNNTNPIVLGGVRIGQVLYWFKNQYPSILAENEAIIYGKFAQNNDSVRDFYTKLNRHARRMHMNDEEFRRKFLEGLLPEWQDEAMRIGEDLPITTLVSRLEKIELRRKARGGSSTRTSYHPHPHKNLEIEYLQDELEEKHRLEIERLKAEIESQRRKSELDKLNRELEEKKKAADITPVVKEKEYVPANKDSHYYSNSNPQGGLNFNDALRDYRRIWRGDENEINQDYEMYEANNARLRRPFPPRRLAQRTPARSRAKNNNYYVNAAHYDEDLYEEADNSDYYEDDEYNYTAYPANIRKRASIDLGDEDRDFTARPKRKLSPEQKAKMKAGREAKTMQKNLSLVDFVIALKEAFKETDVKVPISLGPILSNPDLMKLFQNPQIVQSIIAASEEQNKSSQNAIVNNIVSEIKKNNPDVEL